MWLRSKARHAMFSFSFLSCALWTLILIFYLFRLLTSYPFFMTEYAYTMRVTEKCDIYSYGVVLLELLTGKPPVQALDQGGGDLVTRVRHYVRNHSFTTGILDDRLNLNDRSIVDHMVTVLKIALTCTSLSPFDRPSMREVVTMLIESKRQDQEDNYVKSPTCSPPKCSASWKKVRHSLLPVFINLDDSFAIDFSVLFLPKDIIGHTFFDKENVIPKASVDS